MLNTIKVFLGVCLLCLGVLNGRAAEAESGKKIRVACIGDSITFGSRIKDREKESYPAVLQRLLGDAYEVRNFGDPGRGVILATMRGNEPRAFYKRPGHKDALAFKPHIVICNLGINDDLVWDSGEAKQKEFVADYITLLKDYQALETKPKIFIWTKLAPILKGHRSFDSKSTSVAFRMRRDLEKAAFDAGVIGIDMFNPLHGVDHIMSNDGIHPIGTGAAKIAESTYTQIKPWLDIESDRLELPWYVGDHMVVQRGKSFRFPIRTVPRATVKISLNADSSYTATADVYGRCNVVIPPLTEGKTHTLTIAAPNAKREVKDVVAGEVWLAVGQSNMEWTLAQSNGGKEALGDLSSAAKRNIRMLNRQRVSHTNGGAWDLAKLPKVETPEAWLKGEWRSLEKANPNELSGISFFFGEQLYKNIDVPVGVITVAVGGIPAESLISELGLLSQPRLADNFSNILWFDNPKTTLAEWPLKRAKENLGNWLKQKEKTAAAPYHYFQPAMVHRAGIEPLRDLHFAGVLYYQGESNATTCGKPDVKTDDALNELVYTEVIRDYRRTFKNPALPFIMIELPKMNRPWEDFRKIQRKVCKAENAYLCDIFEYGTPNDVHPRNKKGVGERLAAIASKYVYGNGKRPPISAAAPALIPTPKNISWQGTTVPVKSFIVGTVMLEDDARADEIRRLAMTELPKLGIAYARDPKGAYSVVFGLDKSLKVGTEGYSLKVDSRRCWIDAPDARGLYYGYQTLLQLITPAADGKPAQIACCEILDEPAFPIRGAMNDIGRNFMSVKQLKEIFDVMARYKLNTYHFHCTEYYGWRMESKRYPQLNADSVTPRQPGKYYTQAEFVELVDYARLRGITIIPEFDLPGHSEAFRNAFGFKKMEDPAATKILVELIDELCALVPKEKMPYFHIGGDEAHGAAEKVSAETLKAYFDAVKRNGRQPLAWSPGEKVQMHDPIYQTWTGRRSRPPKGSKYIDSQENYVNHLDPFEAVSTLFFRKNCPFPDGLGGILCSWPDLYMADERDHVLQTPVFQSLVTYSESLWRNSRPDYTLYYSNLPPQGSPELAEFAEFEERLIAHRDRYFGDQEFTYVKQSDIPWKVIGPFPNNGKTATVFDVEKGYAESYTVGDKTYRWLPETYTGATLVFKHYCDYPTFANQNWKFESPNTTYYAATAIYSPKDQTVPFWIGAQTFATSDLRGAPSGVPGKWYHMDGEFFVNGQKIPPPEWEVPNKQNGRGALSPKLDDEGYHYRKPAQVQLKKGWNKVLVKSPCTRPHRWMFTFVPVQWDGKKMGAGVKEFPGLKFSVEPLANGSWK